MKLTFLLAAYQKPPDANRLLMPHGGREARGPHSDASATAYAQEAAVLNPKTRKKSNSYSEYANSLRASPLSGDVMLQVCGRTVCFGLHGRNITPLLKMNLG